MIRTPSLARVAIRMARVIFAVVMAALGILGLLKGDFIGLWQPVPKDLPAREWIAYLCALIPLVSGLGLPWKRTARGAAGLAAGWFVLWLLAFRVPAIVHAPLTQDPWSGLGETAVYAAAAWVLYGWRVRLAQALYGLAMIPFGIGHFAYIDETAQLVPAWLTAHLAIAYFTGIAFIAAGIAIVAGVLARWAAILSTIQMGLFTALVWVPIVLAGPDAFQWSEFVVSVTLTAAGAVVAASYRGKAAVTR